MDKIGQGPRQSSNAFASGSNQNCGNQMTETPTTRVLRPPGGASSISFGWDDGGGTAQPQQGRGGRDPGAAAGGGRRANANANTNQNSGNVMSDRATTRVIRSPGGESSFSLGWGNDSPPEQQPGGRARAPQNGGYSAGGQPQGRSSPSQNADYYDEPEPARGPYPPQAESRGRYEPDAQRSPMAQRDYEQEQERDERRSPQSSHGERPRVTGNSYASGGNQNCGNVMTNVPSTRVKCSPGGNSSLSLAWDDAGDRQQGAGSRQQDNRRQQAEPPRRNERDDGAPGQYERQYEPDAQRSPMAQRDYEQEQERDERRSGQANHGTRPRVTGNSYASGGNQNCGNVMTDVASTRVLASPGGNSSLSLAWDEPAPRQQVAGSRAATGGGVRRGDPNSSAGFGQGRNQEEGAFGARGRVSGNTFASGSDQNCGNVITDRSSTRIHAPPGGASSLGSII